MPIFKNNWAANPWDSLSRAKETLPNVKNLWSEGTPAYDQWFEDDADWSGDEAEALKSESMVSLTKHHRAFLKEVGIRLYQFCRSTFNAIGDFSGEHYEVDKNEWSVYGSKFILALSAIEAGYNNWVGSPAQKANNFFGIGGAYTNSEGESTFKSFEDFNACVTYLIIMFDARNWETAFTLLENTNAFTADVMNEALNSYTYFQNPNPSGVYSYNTDADPNEPSGRLNYAKKIQKAQIGVTERFVIILKEEIAFFENELSKKTDLGEAISYEIPLEGVVEYAEYVSLNDKISILKNILKEIQ